MLDVEKLKIFWKQNTVQQKYSDRGKQNRKAKDPPQLHISDVMTGADSHVTVCVTHSVNPLHVSALNSSPTEVGALSPFALVETETEM